MGYRPEIDGLRAVAVLSVLLFHIDERLAPGGYLGVDIFFALSGYLITAIALRDMAAGRFSTADFLARRARRILPALLVVTLATLAVGPFFLWPWQLEDLATSAIGVLSFTANMVLLGEVGYFHDAAAQTPLLHMWSLAVEAQFYLLIPPLLLLASLMPNTANMRGKTLCALISFLGLVSLIAALVMAADDPAAAFYLFEARLFEFCIGALVAILARWFGYIDGRMASIMALTGLICVLLSLTFIAPHPSDPETRLPVLMGTAMILITRPGQGLAREILTFPILRGIGLISFSLYLWHQPVLALLRIQDVHTPVTTPLAILAIALLAVATWRFVEQPFRTGQGSSSQVLLRSGGALLAGIACAAFIFFLSERLTYVADEDVVLAWDVDHRSAYVIGDYYQHELPTFTQPEKPGLLIIGDSFSQDFLNITQEVGGFLDHEIATAYVPAICQPYFGPENVDHLLASADRSICRNRASYAPPEALLEEAEVIILAARWASWSAARVAEIVAGLRRTPAQDIIVIGPKYFGEKDDWTLHAFRGIDPAERNDAHMARQGTQPNPADDINETLRRNIKGAQFVDMLGAFCIQGLPCPAFTPEGVLLTYDGEHLTQAGARYIGKKIFDIPPLSRFASE